MELTEDEDELFHISQHELVDIEEYAQELIDGGVDVNIIFDSQNCLMLACESLQYDLIKIFLKNGANMYQCDRDGNCAFIYLLKKYTNITSQLTNDLDNWYVENELRKINRMSDDEYKEYNKNPIINQYLSIYHPEKDELKRLVKRLANRTFDGSIEIIDSIIKLFIDNGFDINFVNESGNSLLNLSLSRYTYENEQLSDYFCDSYATRKLIKLGCNTNELRSLSNIDPVMIDWMYGDFNEEHSYSVTRRDLMNSIWAHIDPVPE